MTPPTPAKIGGIFDRGGEMRYRYLKKLRAFQATHMPFSKNYNP